MTKELIKEISSLDMKHKLLIERMELIEHRGVTHSQIEELSSWMKKYLDSELDKIRRDLGLCQHEECKGGDNHN